MVCPHCGFSGKTPPTTAPAPFRPKKRVRFAEPLCTFYEPYNESDSSSPVIVHDVPAFSVSVTPPPVTFPPPPLTFEPTVTAPSSNSCARIKIYRSDREVYAFRCR